MRRLVITCCLALLVGLVPALGPLAPSAQAAAPVVARTGVLTTHAVGNPVADTPAWRVLVEAAVSVDVTAARVRARITLGGVPQLATDKVTLVFGHSEPRPDGPTCVGETAYDINTFAPADGSRTGAVVTVDFASAEAAQAAWDCAIVASISLNPQTPIRDVLVGPLTAAYGPEPAPQLSITDVTLLGSSIRSLKLVRGAWTTLTVRVANAPEAAATAEGLVVTGSGRGLAVRASAPESVGVVPGAKRLVRVKVRLTGKRKPGALTLVARSRGAATSRAVPVRAVAAPAKAKSGRYVGRKSAVRFTIRNGRVVGFRAKVTVLCGGGPFALATIFGTYSHPTTKIPRSGLIDDVAASDGESTTLQLKVVGGKVTRGTFSYYGRGLCSGQVSFTARKR